MIDKSTIDTSPFGDSSLGQSPSDYGTTAGFVPPSVPKLTMPSGENGQATKPSCPMSPMDERLFFDLPYIGETILPPNGAVPTLIVKADPMRVIIQFCIHNVGWSQTGSLFLPDEVAVSPASSLVNGCLIGGSILSPFCCCATYKVADWPGLVQGAWYGYWYQEASNLNVSLHWTYLSLKEWPRKRRKKRC